MRTLPLALRYGPYLFISARPGSRRRLSA